MSLPIAITYMLHGHAVEWDWLVLLMASSVVPRLLLSRLQEWGDYAPTETARRELRAIDRLLSLESLYEQREGVFGKVWRWRDALKVLSTDQLDDRVEVDRMWPIVETIDHSQFEVSYTLASSSDDDT